MFPFPQASYEAIVAYLKNRSGDIFDIAKHALDLSKWFRDSLTVNGTTFTVQAAAPCTDEELCKLLEACCPAPAVAGTANPPVKAVNPIVVTFLLQLAQRLLNQFLPPTP